MRATLPVASLRAKGIALGAAAWRCYFFAMSRSRICIFCGSRPGRRPEYVAAAEQLGRELARRGKTLVYGGASVGLMGAVADAVIAAGGETIGVVPEALVARELAHGALSKLHVVDTLATRKTLMIELSDAFLALPGGFGTLDELFEVLTLGALGIEKKPVGLLDTARYFAPLSALVEQMIAEGFVPADQRALLVADETPAALLDAIDAFTFPTLGPKWLEKVGA
jgi:uncharacterized protein (TIGR00730 family)